MAQCKEGSQREGLMLDSSKRAMQMVCSADYGKSSHAFHNESSWADWVTEQPHHLRYSIVVF